MSMSEGGDEDDGCEGGRDSIVIRCEGEGTWLAATTCVEAGGSTGVAEDEEGEEGWCAPNSLHPFVSYQVRP